MPVRLSRHESHICVTKFRFHISKQAEPPSPPEDITVTGFDHNGSRRPESLPQRLAQDLDCGDSQGVARILQDIYRSDRRDFSNIVKDINRREQNGRGDDLTITQNGEVYVSDCNRQIRVGRIEDNRGHGGGGRRDDNCDPRDRGRDWDRGGGQGRRDDNCDPRDRGHDWDRGNGRGRDNGQHGRGRGGVDVDIDINGGRGRGRGGVDIDVDINLGRGGRYPGGSIPIPDCFPDVRPLPQPRDRDCDPRDGRQPRYEECDPPVVYRPRYEDRRPPYVDRDCNPPVIRRRDRDCEPVYRPSRRGGGGGGGGEFDQDGEIAGTILGGVIGGVIGHNNSGRRDNTLLGVLAGGALGNVVGREVDRNRNQQNYRWR